MITADDLVNLRHTGRDSAETERIKNKLARHKEERSPFFITGSEFDEILHWYQYSRGSARNKVNTDDIVQAVTRLALNIFHPNAEYEAELRIGILCVMRDVTVSIASAILALTYPHNYAIIDLRGWRQIFSENRLSFSIPDYQKYLQQLRSLAEELGWPVQEVDLAIWEYDRRHGSRH